jgi:hypothetical protein
VIHSQEENEEEENEEEEEEGGGFIENRLIISRCYEVKTTRRARQV